jgi:hypothetical protein
MLAAASCSSSDDVVPAPLLPNPCGGCVQVAAHEQELLEALSVAEDEEEVLQQLSALIARMFGHITGAIYTVRDSSAPRDATLQLNCRVLGYRNSVSPARAAVLHACTPGRYRSAAVTGCCWCWPSAGTVKSLIPRRK